MSEQPPTEHAEPVSETYQSSPGTVARIFAVLIPAGICVAGIAFAGVLVATRPAAERAAPQSQGIPVRVETVQPSDEAVTIRAQGQVIAARQVVMQPELNGRVTWMSDDLVPGGRLAAGDTLVRIDPRDFRAALEQQRAQVENSRVNVSTEESRRLIAEREWALLERERTGASEGGRELALREPHTRAAEASLRAARSGLQQAQTNLSRTSLRAPFDSIVIAENVDVGQLVGPASQLATLVGTEHFWVRVPIPMEQLRFIRLPNGEATGSEATVRQHVGESDEIVRTGRVVRLLGDLDPVGRMARVLVEIDDPLGPAGELPMLLGASVDVEIEAGVLEGVFRIPRSALHASDQVHLFGGGALAIQDVRVAWREDESLLVRGLTPGDEIILSTVSPPIAGTALRRVEELNAEASQPTASAEGASNP